MSIRNWHSDVRDNEAESLDDALAIGDMGRWTEDRLTCVIEHGHFFDRAAAAEMKRRTDLEGAK